VDTTYNLLIYIDFKAHNNLDTYPKKDTLLDIKGERMRIDREE
jgi:hypothetical protein